MEDWQLYLFSTVLMVLVFARWRICAWIIAQFGK